MQVRPVTGIPRARYRVVIRFAFWLLRWTFISIGAVAAASVLFAQLYSVNEEFYDPAQFAIGVAGLFSIACGVMLILLTRNSRLRLELRSAKARCEALADGIWELKEAEARATSLLEAQGDVIVRRDKAGRITYANDAYCALAGESREALLGSTAGLKSIQQGRSSVLPDGTHLHDQQVATPSGPRWLAWRDVVVWAEQDESAEVQSVGSDVTDRMDAERALADARDAAEAGVDGIILVDLPPEEAAVEAVIRRLLGSPDAPEGRAVELMAALDAGYAESVVAGVVNTQEAAKERLRAFADGSGARIKPAEA